MHSHVHFQRRALLGTALALAQLVLAASSVHPALAAPGDTVVVSQNGGQNGTNASLHPSISDDGRFVVFESTADNLADGDSNHSSDVFIRDTLRNSTAPVSIASGGDPVPVGDSAGGSVNNDGNQIVFLSRSS